MFIGREKELEALEKRYRSDHFEFPVIYGRRRIGKTRLIQEFIREKKAIYFMATEQSEKEQLKSLTAAIREQYPDEQTKLIDRFSGFESLFSYMTQISKDRRIILAIDEYPYLAKAVPSISSLLQKFIDQEWSHTKLYLILCGSSMSFMERQVLQYKSPLYGRRTAQLKLHPLPWYESIRLAQHGNSFTLRMESAAEFHSTFLTFPSIKIWKKRWWRNFFLPTVICRKSLKT